MKQHITVEQLSELTEEQFNKAIEQEWGMVTAIRHAKDEICRRCFTIGKMIEILEQDHFIVIFTSPFAYELYVKPIDDVYEKKYSNKELIEILWEAVKEVL